MKCVPLKVDSKLYRAFLLVRLKAVTRQKQVQMKSVIRIGAVVEAIEDVSGRASIVQHGEFRRVKKSA